MLFLRLLRVFSDLLAALSHWSIVSVGLVRREKETCTDQQYQKDLPVPYLNRLPLQLKLLHPVAAVQSAIAAPKTQPAKLRELLKSFVTVWQKAK